MRHPGWWGGVEEPEAAEHGIWTLMGMIPCRLWWRARFSGRPIFSAEGRSGYHISSLTRHNKMQAMAAVHGAYFFRALPFLTFFNLHPGIKMHTENKAAWSSCTVSTAVWPCYGSSFAPELSVDVHGNQGVEEAGEADGGER